MRYSYRVAGGKVAPGIILPLFQGNKYLEAVESMPILEAGTPEVYFPTIPTVAAMTEVSRVWRGNVAESGFDNHDVAAPVYNIQARTAMVNAEAEAFNRAYDGVSMDGVLDYIARQAVINRDNFLTFWGVNSNGLIDGASTETLPNDSGSQNKVTDYVIGELFQFLATKLSGIAAATLNKAKVYTLVAPFDFCVYIRSTYIPITDYQAAGAGTATIAGALAEVAKQLGGELVIVENDFFKAEQSGETTDSLLICARAIKEDGGIQNSGACVVKCERNGIEVQVNPEINSVLTKNYSLLSTPGVVLREDCAVVVTYSME